MAIIGRVKAAALFLMLTIAMVSTAGCGLTGYSDGKSPEQTKAVQVMLVTPSASPMALNYIGTVDAKELVKYSFKVSGLVKRIYVEEGEQVKKGRCLAQLDTTDLAFQTAAAKSAMDTAEVSVTKASDAADYARVLLERTDALYKSDAVAKDALDQVSLRKSTAESEYLQARSQYAAAQTDYNYKADLLSNTSLYAEQNGYVVKKNCNENERIAAFTPVVIVRSQEQIVNIGIPQQELEQIKVGASATVTVDKKATPGTITSLSELPDSSTHTYKAEVAIQDKTFRLGSIARVSVNIGDQPGIWIPLTTIFSDEGENCIYIVKNGRAFKRTVTIQNLNEDQARVTGLKARETLVISGMNNLDDGCLVKIQKQE